MVTLQSAMTYGRHRSLMLGAAALATSGFLFTLKDSVALLVGHFGVTMATAFVICSLILENSVWLSWVFPYIIPVEITVQVLVAVFGLGFAAAW
ncbi:MAG TPA: hypothetical protein VGG90_11720 [Candidatus Dormibacteraeota bacterium]|jgi:hypothetical protein